MDNFQMRQKKIIHFTCIIVTKSTFFVIFIKQVYPCALRLPGSTLTCIKLKAFTRILVWLCSRVYEKQEAHGPNGLHDKHIQSFNVFVQSDRYTILRFSDKKNPFLLIKNWKLKFPSSKDVFVLSMVKIGPVVLKKIFVSFIANSFLSPLWKTA